jgi:hypothetical protein
MEISIPVLYNNRQGTVSISVLSGGKRVITIDLDGQRMELIQNGDIQNTSVKGIIQGTLYKLLGERTVGTKNWRVQDFILNITTPRGDQKRIVQASGQVLEDIKRAKIGEPVICEVNFLGKEFNRGEEYVYRNLDEVFKIHLI